MNTLTAIYHVVTPMFLGGAEPHGPPDLRATSVKGLIRFWWRAVTWAQVWPAQQNDRDALKALRQREDSLFGSTRSGQSKVLLSIEWIGDPAKVTSDWPPNRPPVGSTYLGYGITENRSDGQAKPHKKSFLEGERNFRVIVRWHRLLSSDDSENLRTALMVLGLLGGLGSRSRRGFGSIALTSIDGKDCLYSSVDDYEQSLRRLISRFSESSISHPPLTAFCNQSRVSVSREHAGSAREAHRQLGEAYRNHRGQPSALRGRRKIAFGLPLQKIDEAHRRASPLFLHVHPVADRFVSVALFLPARFHPDIANTDHPGFYQDVGDFLECSHFRPTIA